MSSSGEPKRRQEIRSSVRYFALVSQIGLQFIFCVLLGGFAGLKIDSFLNTTPLFSILGIILGIIAGGISVYRLIIKTED